MIAFIDEHREAYGVEPICRVLPIAPSSYYAHAARRRNPDLLSSREKRDRALAPEIRRVFEENFSVYGARKVWRQLRQEGFEVARCTVERLMRAMGLHGAVRSKKVRTTIADRLAPCPLDLVERRFQAPRPNALWVSDFAYVATWTGFVYVAFMIDAFARWRRRLAGQPQGAGWLCARRPGAGASRPPARGRLRPRPSLRPRRAVCLDQVQ